MSRAPATSCTELSRVSWAGGPCQWALHVVAGPVVLAVFRLWVRGVNMAASSGDGGSGTGGSGGVRATALAEAQRVWFIRHGEAMHNAGFREIGEAAYESWDFEDALLTEAGEAQARALQDELAGVQIDAALVSPLTRTLQTLHLGVPGGDYPIEAFDEVRETHGVHPVNKRKTVEELASKWSKVNFSKLKTNEDAHWSMTRETPEAVSKRAGEFLAYLRTRKERNIVVVSHNDYLTATFNLPEFKVADELRANFKNCEVRAVVLTPE